MHFEEPSWLIALYIYITRSTEDELICRKRFANFFNEIIFCTLYNFVSSPLPISTKSNQGKKVNKYFSFFLLKFIDLMDKNLHSQTIVPLVSQMMRLNKVSLANTSTGQVVNMLSNDVSRYDLVFLFLHSFWIMPIMIALIVYTLWLQVGVSCLAGISLSALMALPVQGTYL